MLRSDPLILLIGFLFHPAAEPAPADILIHHAEERQIIFVRLPAWRRSHHGDDAGVFRYLSDGFVVGEFFWLTPMLDNLCRPSHVDIRIHAARQLSSRSRFALM